MSSPTKTVPLASGSDDEPRMHQTTRAFFCGVVVEGAGDGELAQGKHGLALENLDVANIE